MNKAIRIAQEELAKAEAETMRRALALKQAYTYEQLDAELEGTVDDPVHRWLFARGVEAGARLVVAALAKELS